MPQALDACRRAIPMVRAQPSPEWQTLAELYMGAVNAEVALGDTASLARPASSSSG